MPESTRTTTARRAPAVTDLRAEHHRPAGRLIGVETAEPRLSWRVSGAPAGWVQHAYEVEVTRSGVVTTSSVDSREQVLVPWPVGPLASREEATVRVRLRGDDGALTEWSQPLVIEAALLDPAEWLAELVSPVGIGEAGGRAPVIGVVFDVDDTAVVSARLRATGHGLVEPSLNGERVDDTVLNPGWTSYAHRLQVVTWDVTSLIRPGANTLEVLLGNGWWRGTLGYYNETAVFGDRLALAAQLEIVHVGGRRRVLATGAEARPDLPDAETGHRVLATGAGDQPSWYARESAVLADDLYHGQTTDLRLETAGGDGPRYPVEVVPAGPRGHEERPIDLVPVSAPLIRPTEVLPAQKVWRSPSGRTLVDFGQNAVGVVRLTVRGLPAGTQITVRHAEVLEAGELSVRPLRFARATDTWILDGPAERVLQPSLTLHGLRYAEVTGVEDLAARDVELVVIGSDLERTGTFTCSHPLIDRLHRNIVWSARGNFVGIPTDCPQRDERLGWTGDIQVFAPTASFLYDVSAFLISWLADVSAEQYPDGGLPHVVPGFQPDVVDPAAAAWGDAAVLVPWALHEGFGDLDVLHAQLASMAAWVDREAELAGDDLIWSGGFQYGDWLDPTAPPDRPADAKADPDVVATAYLARSAQVVAEAAALVGDTGMAERYSGLARQVRAAYNRAFVTPDGRIHSDSPTVYAQAIVWDLLAAPGQRAFAGNRLADLVRLSGFHIATGFVGTPLVLPALTATGHTDVAARLLAQCECPSWLYPVTMGATTVWERWDSMLPDGSVNPGEMTSFNHYALGAVADWLHRELAGLAPAAPGYRRVRIAPTPVEGVTSASATHLSPYGEIAVAWDTADGRIRLSVSIPVGVSADVRLPGGEHTELSHGHHELSGALPATRRPVPATVREVMDDPGTWQGLVDVMADAGPLSLTSAELAGRMRRVIDAPAAAIAPALTPDPRTTPAGLRTRIEEAVLRPAGGRGQAGRSDCEVRR